MGLRVPLVYNTSAYDSVTSLRELNGIIDIYLPDLRYASDKWAQKFSHTPNYVDQARQAIREMHRQVGNLVTDESGLAQRGLIIRHLILPNNVAGSEDTLTWLARELSSSVTVSIMSQYVPIYRSSRIPLLDRTISPDEYESVLQLLSNLGLENGWMQEMGAAENYLPDFERKGHPFSVVSEEQGELMPGKGIS